MYPFVVNVTWTTAKLCQVFTVKLHYKAWLSNVLDYFSKKMLYFFAKHLISVEFAAKVEHSGYLSKFLYILCRLLLKQSILKTKTKIQEGWTFRKQHLGCCYLCMFAQSFLLLPGCYPPMLRLKLRKVRKLHRKPANKSPNLSQVPICDRLLEALFCCSSHAV